ncbi:MAG TPA: hypothetical protein VG929_09770 [Actinomycetota bacterium]|nr:hypothetical protein [Actinomycetota bacterium]
MAGEARTEKASAGFAELFAGESPYPLGGGEKIRVLDEPARFGAIHEGFAVEFSQRGCEYALIGYMDGKELKRFAQGLRLPGERVPAKPSDGEDFAAIWPEDTYEHAEEACASAAHEADSWRADPERTALKFGAVVLGWDDPVLAESEEKYNQDYAYELRPAPSSRAGVIVFPVLIDQGWCWAIGSVSQLPEHQPEHHGSMSVQDRDVYMRFDTGGATSAVFEVGYGGQTSRHIWYAGDDEAVEFRLDFEPRGTGHFLVLLRDENDVVFSAFGSPLPEGSFAAG